MTERVYMNRRQGEERVHVEVWAWELAPIIRELRGVPYGRRTGVGDRLLRTLIAAAGELGVDVPPATARTRS